MSSFFSKTLSLLYCLITIATFVYLLVNTNGWTWWNSIFLVGLCVVQATIWWIYWPLHIMFGIA